jgi:hypothetical protein
MDKQVITADVSPIRYRQHCLLFENTRELPEGMRYCNTPWVCDECREAIAFIKKQLKRDPLEPMLD